MTINLIWVTLNLRYLQTSKLKCLPENHVGLMLSVEMTWDSPAAIKSLGMDEKEKHRDSDWERYIEEKELEKHT